MEERLVYGVPAYQEQPDEQYMNAAQRDHFKAILENWRLMLRDEISRTVSHMREDIQKYPDPNDRATQEEEFAIELRTRDRERKLLKKIEAALQKIAIENYGYCEMCGSDIGIRRLEARPTAELCIDCKTIREKLERY